MKIQTIKYAITALTIIITTGIVCSTTYEIQRLTNESLKIEAIVTKGNIAKSLETEEARIRFEKDMQELDSIISAY